MSTANDPWGRVDDDGTVYVRTGEGERVVGIVAGWQPGGGARVLQAQVRLAGHRDQPARDSASSTTDLSPAQARATITRLLAAVADAKAVGDLDGLRGRLEAMTALVDHRREEHKAARDQASVEAHRGQGADRRRSGADRGRGDALEDQRRADAPVARGVEDRAARRPGGRDGPVEAAVRRPQRVHQAPQGILRRAGGRARGRRVRKREAGQPRPRPLPRRPTGGRQPPLTAS